ncbi:MAG TPA: copper homeostasis protein CutC, partial [Gemmatimonadales bacterium]|nr:copper homeostasis protein CutC [Gemmatimonadales bacterium]
MSPSEIVLVEAGVATVGSALGAASAGAGRLELCADLVEGGVTPSVGMLVGVRERVRLPLFVLIRPRGGDFLFDGDEREVMLRDIAEAGARGADGVVIGALDPGGRVDEALTRRLAEAARPMAVTFHRAFDLVRAPARELETLIGLGIERVLTSGQAPSALRGSEAIAALVAQAAGRITIMAGAGINEANAARIVRETGVREIHIGAGGIRDSGMEFRREGVFMGKVYQPDEYRRVETDPERVREIV